MRAPGKVKQFDGHLMNLGYKHRRSACVQLMRAKKLIKKSLVQLWKHCKWFTIKRNDINAHLLN